MCVRIDNLMGNRRRGVKKSKVDPNARDTDIVPIPIPIL